MVLVGDVFPPVLAGFGHPVGVPAGFHKDEVIGIDGAYLLVKAVVEVPLRFARQSARRAFRLVQKVVSRDALVFSVSCRDFFPQRDGQALVFLVIEQIPAARRVAGVVFSVLTAVGAVQVKYDEQPVLFAERDEPVQASEGVGAEYAVFVGQILPPEGQTNDVKTDIRYVFEVLFAPPVVFQRVEHARRVLFAVFVGERFFQLVLPAFGGQIVVKRGGRHPVLGQQPPAGVDAPEPDLFAVDDQFFAFGVDKPPRLVRSAEGLFVRTTGKEQGGQDEKKKKGDAFRFHKTIIA